MRRILTAAVGLATVAGSLALAGVAGAETNQVIAQTGGAEATITLLGVPLKVGLELNVDTGDITAVNVTDEAGAAADMTATKVTPTKVRFASNTDGSTTVSVSAKKNAMSFGVKTSDLGNLVGTNTWAADVFGTGSKSSVEYTIGNDGGAPTFMLGTITPGDGVEATDLGDWSAKRGHDDDDDEATAGGRVEFTRDGFRKVLSIVVRVDDDDDHSHASLRVTLTGRNVQRKSLADLAGDKVWTGLLCDGTTRATVNYNVAADGTLTFTSATPDTAQAQPGEKGLTVRFATGDKVRIRLSEGKDGGNAALSINVSGKRCTDPAEKTPPTVNTPTSTVAPSTGDRTRDRDGKRSGDDDRKRDGRDD